MSWFKDVFGFEETQLDMSIFKEGRIVTKDNTFKIGTLDIPTVAELRERIRFVPKKTKNTLCEKLGNVVMFHRDERNAGALFQVASQFNLLEMVSPGITPGHGITRYVNDPTQGPVCAMACPAGTLYRNYKTKVNTLEDVEKLFPENYWTMKNGYAIFEEERLDNLNEALDEYRDKITENLRVGVQWETEVVPSENKHTVSQIYCSALPVSYNRAPRVKFEKFARMILDATYEATILTAILNKNNKVFLTLVGAGAFGNEKRWVLEAAEKALKKYSDYGLDVTFVTYGGRNDPDIQKLIKDFEGSH